MSAKVVYEVFRPRSGRIVARVKRAWVARFMAWLLRADWARKVEGWID
jgi:endonuclease YncB( thermonuclease family)